VWKREQSVEPVDMKAVPEVVGENESELLGELVFVEELQIA